MPQIPVRIGGFGGVEGLRNYLRAEQVEAVVVATHPFAVQMRAHAVEALRGMKMPLLMIERPEWLAGPGDHWTPVADMRRAAAALGSARRRVFLTVGRKDLAPFAAAPWHDYLIRSVDAPPPECLPQGARIVTARGPFDESLERQMLLGERIEVIVTKNSGGAATQAKLAAARALGLPVIMVARPDWPDVSGLEAAVATEAAGALRWLAQIQNGAAERGV